MTPRPVPRVIDANARPFHNREPLIGRRPGNVKVVAQQIMRDQGATAIDLLSPADTAKALGVTESDVMATIESGQLPAKKIGASYRIKRSDLQEYLSR